jgi:hypothetical protein
MTINDMRDALKHRYGNMIHNRHVDYMPDNQIMAIYNSVLERKDLNRNTKPVAKTKRLHDPVKYEQMRMEI